MSRVSRLNPEGFTTRPSETAWGCTAAQGWVPFPPKIPRRHALIDTVGRTDDPCDRPKYMPPDWSPKPSFKPPREGYPHDMCNLEEYGGAQQGGNDLNFDVPEGSAVINVGQNTSQSIHVKLPAMVNTTEDDCPPSLDDCCEQTRNLDVVKEKYKEVVGPLEEREAGHDSKFAKCVTTCQPLLLKYPCRGVIEEPREGPPIIPPERRCKPLSLQSGDPGSWTDQKPIDGWEFIDKCRTCDYYPIDANLPSRFNNPSWFKGYGCENPVHPFYVTTGSEFGRFGPNPHTMTQMYFPRSSAFTEVLGITGMYRNRTLNTSNNKTIV